VVTIRLLTPAKALVLGAIILSGVWFSAACCQHVWAQSNEIPTELTVGAGEIRLDGKIRVVNATQQSLILDATSFTLTNGKMSPLAAPKPKTVIVNAATVLHVRGDMTHKVAFTALHDGVFAIVVGHDTGSGKDLPAREVAVWDAAEGGTFAFKDNHSAVAPEPIGVSVTAPNSGVVTPDTINPGVPDDQAAADENPNGAKNLVVNGSFEDVDDTGRPVGWSVVEKQAVKVVQDEKGNHYVRITATRPWQVPSIQTLLPLPPATQQLRIAARVRVKGLKQGPRDFEDARLSVQFLDANKKPMHYGPAPVPHGDMDWTVLSTRCEVPDQARYAIVTVGFGGSATGELSVDNVSVLVNAPLDAPSLPLGFPQGNFEQLDEKGNPLGWPVLDVRHQKIVEEEGNHFLRTSNDDPNGYPALTLTYRLDPTWQALKIRARMRARNLKVGQQTWQNARLNLTILDALGNRVGNIKVPELTQDSDWVTKETKIPIPENAPFLEIGPGMLAATGTFDIDDIQIEEEKVPNMPPRSLPVTAGFPEGKFEQVGDDGNPRGWHLSNPQHIQVAAENGNHFLRLTNENGQATVATEARFKLDPTAHGIKIKVRLRGKDLQVGATSLDNARLDCTFENSQHDRVGRLPNVPSLKQDSDWITLESRGIVPEGAFFIKLAPALVNTTGTFDVDDIQIEQLP